MTSIASFQTELGTKTWGVGEDAIRDISNFTTSYEVEAEDNESVEGSTLTNVKGLKKQPLSFSSKVLRANGLDPRAEFEGWKEWVSKTGIFRLAGKQFGPNFMLKAVTPSELLMDNKGNWHAVTLSFTFEESDEELDPSLFETPSSDTSTSTAVNVTCSANAKALRKPINSELRAVLLI